MPGTLQPLSKQFPITNPDGTPTEYFIRWAQEKQIDITDGITAAQAEALIEEYVSEWSADRDVNAGTGLSGGGPLSSDVTINLDAVLDDLNDVDTTTTPPTDGQALVWVEADGLWIPGDVASGGGGGGGPFNNAYTTTLVNTSSTTVIPFDSTIPQITEGTEVLTVDLTPESDSSTIRVEAHLKFGSSGGANWAAFALFVNGEADAVDFTAMYCETSGGGGGLTLAYEYVPGTTDTQTFSVRAGNGISSRTITMNNPGASFGGVARSSLAATELSAGGGGGSSEVAYFQDQKAGSTEGGSATAGSWLTRDLNTEAANEIAGASLASNQITLPAGTYRIRAEAPFYQTNRTVIRLYNVTDATTALEGTSIYAGGTTSSVSVLDGVVTIEDTKVFEVQYYCGSSHSTNGLGVYGNGTNQVYTRVRIEKATSGGGGGLPTQVGTYTVATAGDAVIDIPLDADDGKEYQVVIRGTLPSSGTFYLRLSSDDGATFHSGASDYKHGSSNSASAIQLSGSSGTDREVSINFILTGMNGGANTRRFALSGTQTSVESGGSLSSGTVSGYSNALGVGDWNGIQLLTNGTIALDDIKIIITKLAE